MDWIKMLIVIGSILFPMMSGFVWILSDIRRLDDKINDLDKRVSRIEGMLHWLERFFFEKSGTEK